MIQVAIIEDNKYMREGWETFINFESDLTVIGSYDSCEKAFQDESFKKAELVLMDIGLPGMSGIEGVKYIRKKYPEMLVVMATVYDDDDHIFNALKAGASGYLMKKATPDELVKALRDAKNGGSPLTPNVAKKVLDSMFKVKEPEVQLSEREMQILKELATGKSYHAIGKTIFLSEDGVRHHVRNIYRKLEVKTKTEAVSKGLSTGLISVLPVFLELIKI